MSASEKRQLVVHSELSDEPAIGRWLWALDDARRRTKEQLAEIPEATVDWLPGDNESSIGTILYHIALVETDWLCAEVLETEYPPELAELFPHEMRDEQGQLMQVQGVSLAEHIDRLDRVRAVLLRVYQSMDRDDFHRPRHLPQYDVTPEWVLHHLMQHEAEHRSQIGALRQRAECALAQ